MNKNFLLRQENGIRDFIYKLPINTNQKLILHKNLRSLLWKLKYKGDAYKEIMQNLTLCYSNFYYGHEYWLKTYSGFSDFVYGLIEHGIYFGEDTSKVGIVDEWNLGSVLTFGDNRISLLKELYPDYYIVGIGPRIHYAKTDMVYYNELKNKLIPNSKTIALYPSHSLYERKSLYNVKMFLEKAMEVANEIKAKNVLVSLHPSDIANGLDKEFRIENKNIIMVSGGTNGISFLPRLKAIMSLADFIYTNDIGTHVGYSLYLGKQNYIDLSTNFNDYYTDAFLKDQHLFAKAFDFHPNDPLSISVEQKELGDYYFGFSHIKSPEELYRVLEKCKSEYERRFK